MASITLKSLPPALHRALKKQAARHKRSLNQEVILLLERSLADQRPTDIAAELEKERQRHARVNLWTTPEEIDRYKREGRKEW